MVTKNKIVAGTLVVAVIAILFFLLSGGRNITNVPIQKGGPIVVFGDSLVEGVGATEDNDLVSIFESALGEPVINLGKSGDTTELALARLDAAINYDPRLAIVLIGGNDYLRRVPKEETFTNLETIVKTFQNKSAAVLLLGVRGGALRDTYAGDFENFAEKHKTAYVPNVLDGLLGNSEFMSDGIHPNNAGYRKIAERVLPVLRDMLEE